ncbi:MAG TPA: DNA methyltransferase [Chitinophagales bacterium]|nr:DNA methyltransferase [Chitinophagales bacterium]
METYLDFLKRKIKLAGTFGFDVPQHDIHPLLFPHQRDIVRWALDGGRRAVFASFGLGKTFMQLEIARHVVNKTERPFLIGIPLGVKHEFEKDANTLGYHVWYIKEASEIIRDPDGTPVPAIYLTNYERIRAGKFDASVFAGVSFDEASVLRSLDTLTSDYILDHFAQVPYRFVCTATPSPNDYTEILNYAQFLGTMDRGQSLTRFFQRDSQKAGNLTLYPHKEKEFWLWVSSWAVFVAKPSDLGYSDEGYDLPKLNIHYHLVSVSERSIVKDRDGNIKMFRDAAASLADASKEKRESIAARINKAVEIVSDAPTDHWLIWHHLEAERKAIETILPQCKTVYGSQEFDKREDYLIGFGDGKYQMLATKPEIAGSGCNFQRHCHKAIFLGIDYKFNDFIQAVHRIYRFLQDKPVDIHILYTDSEEQILKTLQAKWSRHNVMVKKMTDIISEFGLSNTRIQSDLSRTIGVERKVESGAAFTCVHNDCVVETAAMETNSVDLVVTSIPFSDQYEYCESYHDMGHNDGDGEFFEQLGYLTPELLRVVKPGRVACIHVKDRIRYSYQNGQGFTSLADFSGRTVTHFEKHGWHLLAKITITTDVVQENNQTYRLGWTEQCKDGTKMGAGLPEYVLVFRKTPTDKQNAYADVPVVKSKEDYTRGRWQLDAHAYWRSNGKRLMTPDELRKLDLSQIGHLWRANSEMYEFSEHVQLCETLDKMQKLPATFMAVPPRSNCDLVWDDVSRMHTLNMNQSRKKKEKHVCPLQFDIVDRLIERYSNEGELVYDPFGGIQTVPYRAVKLNRRGLGVELNEQYWRDGVIYCKEAESVNNQVELFKEPA